MNSSLSRACAIVACSIVFSACSSATSQESPSQSAVQLNTPQSVSPGSIAPAPMARTAILPPSVMQSATVRKTQSDIANLSYTQIPGAASFAAAAPDSSLYVLSNQPGGGDKYIWHYSSGSWTNIPGLAARLSVAPNGTLFAINSGGGAYSYSSGTWTALGGGCRDLSAAADGSLYVISNTGGSDGAIWHFASGTWTQQPGSGNRIAASWDPNSHAVPGGTITPGGFYVVTSQGSIYYLASSGYIQVSGTASSVAPITGGVFALGYPADLNNGNIIYYYNLDIPGWSVRGGSGISISSDSRTLYVIAPSGAIYSSAVVPTCTSGTATISFSPQCLAFYSPTGPSQSFTVSENGYSGTFSIVQASSTCLTSPPIATISPTSGATMFSVSPQQLGLCTFVVMDTIGNQATFNVSVSTVTVVGQ